MRISDWSSDVCSSDLGSAHGARIARRGAQSALCAGAYPRAQPPRAARNHRQRDPGSARSMAIHVALGARSYPIHIERGLLGRAADHLVPLARGRTMAIVTDENVRSEEHTSELQSLMRISYAVFCLKKKNKKKVRQH